MVKAQIDKVFYIYAVSSAKVTGLADIQAKSEPVEKLILPKTTVKPVTKLVQVELGGDGGQGHERCR